MKMKNMKKIKILKKNFTEYSTNNFSENFTDKFTENNEENYDIKIEKNSYKNHLEFDAKIANTFTKRLVGLMFKKDAKIPLLFEIPKSKNRTRSAIHTCFMRFEIVIIFIGFDNEIFEIVNLKPWKIYTPKLPAKYIIEIDKKYIKNYDFNKNDKIELI